MRQMTVAAMAAIAVLAASAGLAGCASESSSSSAACGTEQQRGSSAAAASCSNSAIQSQLYAKGMLTVATDKPVYPPWFVNNKPTNGQGYESAVAYAVAAQLGFRQVPGHLGVRAVQQLVRAGAEEVRLRHQRDLLQRGSGPGGHVLATATTTSSRRWWR